MYAVVMCMSILYKAYGCVSKCSRCILMHAVYVALPYLLHAFITHTPTIDIIDS